MDTTKADQIRERYERGLLREQAGAWAVVTTGHGLDLFDDDGRLLDAPVPGHLSSGAQAWAALITHLLGRAPAINIADILVQLDDDRSAIACQALDFIATRRAALAWRRTCPPVRGRRPAGPPARRPPAG